MQQSQSLGSGASTACTGNQQRMAWEALSGAWHANDWRYFLRPLGLGLIFFLIRDFTFLWCVDWFLLHWGRFIVHQRPKLISECALTIRSTGSDPFKAISIIPIISFLVNTRSMELIFYDQDIFINKKGYYFFSYWHFRLSSFFLFIKVCFVLPLIFTYSRVTNDYLTFLILKISISNPPVFI